MTTRQPYPTDLTDRAWHLRQHRVPHADTGGRPAASPKRELLNAISYWARAGGSWRMLAHDLPPRRLVSAYLGPWRRDGRWHVRHDLLRGEVRVAAGTRRQPSAGGIARPSVKTTEQGGSAASPSPTRSQGANGLSSARPSDGSAPWSSRPPVSKTALGPSRCGKSAGTRFPGCAASGPMGLCWG